MAPRLTELCELLVEEKLGQLASEVFVHVARHGRQMLPQIAQRTYIPIKHLRPVVLTLINHNILLWFQEDDSEPVYYQVDWHAAYVLVRQNKLLELVSERLCKEARQLVQIIMDRGKVEVGDLEDQQYFDAASPRDSGIGMMDDQASEDGIATDKVNAHGFSCRASGEVPITSVTEFHDILRDLLKDGYLSKATPRDHVPIAELEDQLRLEVITANPKDFKDGKTTGPKTAVTFMQMANVLKRKWQDEAQYSERRDVASQGTLKRAKHSKSSSNKRRKVDDGLTTGFHDFHADDEDEVTFAAAPESSARKLPNDLWLRVNYNKCMIALRSDRLELLAANHVSSMSAAVYSGVLDMAESKTGTARTRLRARECAGLDDEDDPADPAEVTITDMEMADRIEKGLDLASAIKDASAELVGKPSNGEPKNGKKRRLVPHEDEDLAGVGIKQEVESDDEDEPDANGRDSPGHRQKYLNQISTHLDLLGESPMGFLRRNTEKRTSTITLSVLSDKLAEEEMDDMILARVGQIGLRICRILREKGKLQDTQIAGLSLIRLKDLRAILTNLQFQGLIDVQEVPKDNFRQPSRTTYLWYFNEHDVRQKFLQETYLAMRNTLLRLQYERDQNKPIIEKAESVDFDLKRLNKPERDLWSRWQSTEETLLGTMDALDAAVMVLRDFDETETSLLT